MLITNAAVAAQLYTSRGITKFQPIRSATHLMGLAVRNWAMQSRAMTTKNGEPWCAMGWQAVAGMELDGDGGIRSVRRCSSFFRQSMAAILLAAAATPIGAVDIDGRVDAEEWREARHVVDFRKVQPLNGEPASHLTEAWILATPDGLAVAFRNHQPPSVPRTQQRVQRDFDEQVDRVNVMVDFDADHRTGYAFTVSSTNGISDAIITNETNFNSDWDGNWRHAVTADDDGWSAEVLIPWHIASMRGADGDKRTLRIYLDRVIGATGERAGWPHASFERPRFLSDFAVVEVAHRSLPWGFRPDPDPA